MYIYTIPAFPKHRLLPSRGPEDAREDSLGVLIAEGDLVECLTRLLSSSP